MRVPRGMAWLGLAFWVVVVCGALSPAQAQSSLETQMLGEKPAPPSELPASLRSPSMMDQDIAIIRMPYNLEMNISVRYQRDHASMEPPRFNDPSRYLKYSMDYRVLPNLQVGLNSYLYRPAEDSLLARQYANRLGFGPEVKYNLGRWNFLLKSQVESGNKEHPEGLQNWFRVWYAF